MISDRADPCGTGRPTPRPPHGQNLAAACRRLDGRGYPAYRGLEGAWPVGEGITVFLDRAARDPFAPPSRMRLRVEGGTAGFPAELFSNRIRRVALADYLARRVELAIRGSENRQGSGRSGEVRVDCGGQEVLERAAVRIGSGAGAPWVEARLEVGLPAAGRRILGERAAHLLVSELTRIAAEALVFSNLPTGGPDAFVRDIENQEHLRDRLAERRLAAFVADGAVLPRASGASELPLEGSAAVAFTSPPPLRVHLPLLHPEGGSPQLSGMGIPEGVTLIVGGGFHGKSTLLQALARAVAPHLPGDGRERVVTRSDAVTIRAEEGRPVFSVDVSPFLRELPGGRTTTAFTTENASGSTSQAASIVEALEAGARVLLMDEDTSATNLMIRDARMQALVSRDSEPIVPLLDRVRELYDEHRVSTILVMGGSGDYFEAADTVIQLADYRPREVTAQARRVAAELPSRRVREPAAGTFAREGRIPDSSRLDPAGRRGGPRIRAARRDALLYGEEEVDLGALDQLFDPSQTRAAGHALALAYRSSGGLPVAALLDGIEAQLDREGLDSLTEAGRAGRHPGRLARPRRHEIAAVLNRIRSAERSARAREQRKRGGKSPPAEYP